MKQSKIKEKLKKILKDYADYEDLGDGYLAEKLTMDKGETIEKILSVIQKELIKEINNLYEIPFPEFNDVGRKTNLDYKNDGKNEALSEIRKIIEEI